MTTSIAIALCGLSPLAASRITTWLAGHEAMKLQVAYAVDSAAGLLERLASQPVHGVIIDSSLGLEGVSFARDLLEAGYTAVGLAGTVDRPHVRQRAAELGLPVCADYEPTRLAAMLRHLLGLSEGEVAEGQVIAFHSPRGGAGTSTLLLQMARLLNERGHNVAVVEVGGGGSAVPTLGLRPDGGWSDLLPALRPALGGDPDGPMLVSRSLVEVGPGLHLLPSGGPAIMDQVGADEVESVLRLLPITGIEYILVDTSAEMTLPTAAALAAAHAICLIALPDPISAFRLVQVQDALTGLQVFPDRIHPVINRTRDAIPQRLQEVLEFLRYRPTLRVPEEPKSPVDPAGRFTGFRPGSGAAKAVESLLEALAPETNRV